MASTAVIGWEEYLVFSVVFLFSAGTGIFYGCFGSKQKSTEEYLLADRQMPYFPVALSMTCSSISAITLLASPVEVYLYGTQYILIMFSFAFIYIFVGYFYVPVYFNLHVQSAYEFIELRFSHAAKICTSVLSLLHLLTSMAIIIYSPALAIHQVIGVEPEITCAAIYFVCIFYSTLGGLKAVLWTDVFQTTVMLGSVTAIMIKVTSDLGGFGNIWSKVEDNKRVEFLNFDLDPRVRHTVWTSIIGGYFFWVPTYASSQLQVQRYLSMPDITTARKALLLACFGLLTTMGLSCYAGLALVAKYHDCDPINGLPDVEKSDELVPYFVRYSTEGAPGLLGLFVAGLVCASMSSLSSGLSAMSSITTYDYLSRLFPDLSDEKLSAIAKVNTFVLGIVSYVFVFVVANMGSILPVSSSLLGIMLGPTLGLFSLGMMFPWANTKGSLLGMIITFVLMGVFVIANVTVTGLPDQKLPLSTDGCYDEVFNETMHSLNSAQSSWKDEEYSFGMKILSISYMWFSGMGCVLTVLIGLSASLIINYFSDTRPPLIDPLCISPPVLSFLHRFFPHHLAKWVKVDGGRRGSSLTSPTESKMEILAMS